MSQKIDPVMFEKALKEVIVSALHEEGSVHVEGLGTFRKVHQGSREMVDASGRVVMLPPEDRIVFDAEEGS